MLSTSSRTQLDTLTGLRAYAALWVVVFHFIKNDGIAGVLDLGPVALEGRWGVEIFFVLSGFVLTHVYARPFLTGLTTTTYLRYIGLRLMRIYPLHVVTLLALVGMVYLASFLGIQPNHPEFYQPEDIGWSLAMLHAWGFAPPLCWNYVSWSISAEWFAYLFLLPLFVLGLRSVQGALLLALGFGGWIVFFYTAAITPEGVYLNPFNSALWRVTVDFLTGYVVYRLWVQGPAKGLQADFCTIAGLGGIIALTFTSGSTRVALLPCIGLLIYGLASSGPVSRIVFASRPVVYLGDISYAIYLIHPLIELVANGLWRLLQIDSSAPIARLLLTGEILLTVIAAAIAFALIEKPCRDWARRRLVRPQPETVIASQQSLSPT